MGKGAVRAPHEQQTESLMRTTRDAAAYAFLLAYYSIVCSVAAVRTRTRIVAELAAAHHASSRGPSRSQQRHHKRICITLH